MKEFIKEIIENEKDHIVFLRRELHKNPELSNNEFKTAEFIEGYLKDIGYIPERIAGTGVVAFLDCEKEDSVLLRSDMDALPIEENSDCDYKSKNENVMHACGHDAHMAMLLCAAKVLYKKKDKLSKNVLFVFQPNEEMEGGAQNMINAGILTKYNVSMALGYHVMNEIPAGKVMIKEGALMASPDDFEIIIKGKGGHGSEPHKCIDPVLISSKLIPELNNITEKTIIPGEKQVVHVCQITGGTSSNVIPDNVLIRGTARAFNEDVRNEIPVIMENIIKEITENQGAEYEFKFNFCFPPVVNDAEAVEYVKEKVITSMGHIVEKWEDGIMAGDDFSFFSKEIPSVYMFLGTGNKEKGIDMTLHSSNFNIDESALSVGVGIYISVLLN